MGLLKIIFYIIVAIVVFSLISTYIININAPQVAHLFYASVTSFFRSASSNSTFTSNGANFTYPGNWIVFTPSVVNGIPILSQQNSSAASSISNEASNSSVSMLIPNSEITSLIGDIPSMISGAISKNISLTKIEQIISNVNLIVVAEFPLPLNFSSNSTNIPVLGSYLSKYNIKTTNTTSIYLSGYKALLVSDKNISIPQINNLKFASVKVAVAASGKNICMVFGLAAKNSSISEVDTAFDRVVKSIRCKST